MTKLTINIGTAANDGTGDTLRNAFDKTNQNFTELYDTTVTLAESIDAVSNAILEETDPIFLASPAYNLTNLMISHINDAYNWGDHDAAGYLEIESDPVFLASAAADIEEIDITNWNLAYSWGDHSVEGYLTANSIIIATELVDATNNNKLLISENGDLILTGFEGTLETPNASGVDRGFEWDYGSTVGGTNSFIKQSDGGLWIHSYTEANTAFSGDVNIITGDVTGINETPEYHWTFGADGNLTAPGDITLDGVVKHSTQELTGGADSGTATALDLTKSVQVLVSADTDDDSWSLADGVEGQIMYFVPKDAGLNNHLQC